MTPRGWRLAGFESYFCAALIEPGPLGGDALPSPRSSAWATETAHATLPRALRCGRRWTNAQPHTRGMGTTATTVPGPLLGQDGGLEEYSIPCAPGVGKLRHKAIAQGSKWALGRSPTQSTVAISLHPKSQRCVTLPWGRGPNPVILQRAGNRNPEFQPSRRKTQRPTLSPILPTHRAPR